MLVYQFIWLEIALGFSAPTWGRRYDVEHESYKLFGEGVHSVLARFRRSPEYLEILKTHMEDIKREKNEITHHIMTFTFAELESRLEAIFGVNSTKRSGYEKASSWETGQRPGHPSYRRDDEPSTNTTDMEEKVYALDNYSMMDGPLTVDEKNRFKDFGFEVAGEVIHKLISHLDPTDSPMQSTRQPWGSGKIYNITNTTEHNHVVTRSSTVTIYVNSLNSTPTATTNAAKYYRQRKKLFR
ncbi:unnamed protein product, partial [Iphiclides podalirius]